MSYELSRETKENLSKSTGIPYDKLIKMSDDEIRAYIKKKLEKNIKWPEGAEMDGLPIRTIKEKGPDIER